MNVGQLGCTLFDLQVNHIFDIIKMYSDLVLNMLDFEKFGVCMYETLY